MSKPKISINLLGWRANFEMIDQAMESVLAQTYPDFLLYYTENDSSYQSIIPQIRAKYGDNPKVRIVENRENLGYAGGHNKFFDSAETELVMVLNPDARLELNFLEQIIPTFENLKVAAATGKMIKPEKDQQGNNILDGTGIIVYKSRRGKERGQMEIDRGQYDDQPDVFGVSGTAAVYRRSALEEIKLPDGDYFDHDFFAYWEDLDLSWRLRLAGYTVKYVPSAIVFHSRVAGSYAKGYKDLPGFIRHHSKFSLNVRRWNWRNHLFCIIKNDFGPALYKNLPRIIVREMAMAGYITLFEPRTWSVLPVFFQLLPKMRAKRKIIQSKRKVKSAEMEKLFL